MTVPNQSVSTQIAADFFVIRTPALSLQSWQQIPSVAALLPSYLLDWYRSAKMREAIYLASPSLVARLDALVEKQVPFSLKECQALLKYLIRFSCRPTPFGLFAGLATGQLAAPTLLQPAGREFDQRKTRLDLFYLATVRQQLTEPKAAADLLIRFYPNQTLWDTGQSWHYIEPYHSNGQQQYRLSTLEKDEALEQMLTLAAAGPTIHQLVQQFGQRYPECAGSEIREYLDQLIEQRVLQADLALPLTSGQPDQSFIQTLFQAQATKTATTLSQCLATMQQADQQGQADVAHYQQIFAELSTLPHPVTENRLFQVDLWRGMQQAQLDPQLLGDIEQMLLALKVLTPEPVNEFQSFIQQFNQRFEGQCVPLLQLLDEEIGISFSQDTGYDTPLLAGMPIHGSSASSSNRRSQLESALMKAWQQLQVPADLSAPQQDAVQCLQLNSQQILQQADRNQLLAQLPASFAVSVTLLQHDEKSLIHFHNCSGPSGANLLGRFCHLSTTLTTQVRQHLAAEAALNPQVILAEVVHMPDGRPGNVIARPALRDYEIVFLADSQQPAEQQITVQELSVFVEDGRVRLWSSRLAKEIIPRLSSAHNYSQRSLGIYRFLCKLQQQQHQTPYFALPQAIHQLEQQPRIQLDQFILREAHWRVERSLLVALVKDTEWQADAWQHLQQRYQITRFVCYAVHDNVLTVDLHNPVLVMLLLAETQHQQQVELKEALHLLYNSTVQDGEHQFAHEIVIPCLNKASKPLTSTVLDQQRRLAVKLPRYFPPGSACLSVKLYAGQSTAEVLLLDVIAAFADRMQQQGLVRQWFFIRYGDPKWHLRVRFFGEPALLCAQVLPQLSALLADWLRSQRLQKFELVSYERELERYGGDCSMELAEQIFCADSQYVRHCLALIPQLGSAVRVRAALLGVDTLLEAFGYGLADKINLISHLRQGFAKEFQESTDLRTQLGKKFRDYKSWVKLDFASQSQNASAIIDPAAELPLLQQQQQKFRQDILPLATQIAGLSRQGLLSCSLDQLMSALLHMHCNRLFKAYGREQEFVIYDFLRRIYLSLREQQPPAL